jgi:hypothetical protein
MALFALVQGSLMVQHTVADELAPPARCGENGAWENDGACDVPGNCADGTDDADCLLEPPPPPPPPAASTECALTDDGECDEDTGVCEIGTDAVDCAEDETVCDELWSPPAPAAFLFVGAGVGMALSSLRGSLTLRALFRSHSKQGEVVEGVCTERWTTSGRRRTPSGYTANYMHYHITVRCTRPGPRQPPATAQ